MPPWRPDFAAPAHIFAPFSEAARFFADFAAWPGVADYNHLARALGIVTASGLPLTFMEQEARPRGRSRRAKWRASHVRYDESIYCLGQVPTRLGSWHDFFNMLVWMTFPQAKAALNRQQYREQPPLVGMPGRSRSREQDRLTMLDEGGVLAVCCAQGIVVHLVFGHALLESLLLGRFDVRGMNLPLVCSEGVAAGPVADLVRCADAALALRIGQGVTEAADWSLDEGTQLRALLGATPTSSGGLGEL